MRLLVTGHRGYIGAVLVPLLLEAGHDVTGLDTDLYDGCDFGPLTEVPTIGRDVRDVRDVTSTDLEGFEAVLHLAAVSNDPVGELYADTTYDINERASVHLAREARAAGVSRFIFSSSCSLYGTGGDEALDEGAAFNPVTAYGRSKVLAEQGISPLATSSFSPVFLRNATAYGVSSRLRGDLVVNNLVGLAVTTGELLITSDGTPWRPLVHIEDISRAFLAALEAPREAVHNQAFNVCMSTENYQVREVAELVRQVVPGSRVRIAGNAQPDKRDYRVSGDRIARVLPGFHPQWTVRRGVEELYREFKTRALTFEDLSGSRFRRIKRVLELQEAGRVNANLRWIASPVASE